jgi:hypothetical protein
MNSADDVTLNCKGAELGIDLSSPVMDFLPGFPDDDGKSIGRVKFAPLSTA